MITYILVGSFAAFSIGILMMGIALIIEARKPLQVVNTVHERNAREAGGMARPLGPCNHYCDYHFRRPDRTPSDIGRCPIHGRTAEESGLYRQ